MSQTINVAIIPTDTELQNLRDQISEAERIAEYEKLKRDLKDIVSQSINTPNEFEGVMQMPDTHQVLKTKREKAHFIELMIERLRGMFSIRPIIGNIIALLIAGIALFYIFDEVGVSHASQGFLAAGIEIFAAIQIIKSATRGLLLPFLALLIGGAASHAMGDHHILFHFGKGFYENLMLAGIVGVHSISNEKATSAILPA